MCICNALPTEPIALSGSMLVLQHPFEVKQVLLQLLCAETLPSPTLLPEPCWRPSDHGAAWTHCFVANHHVDFARDELPPMDAGSGWAQ